MLVVIWVILAFACASFAKRKGRDYWRWLVLSLVLSPFICIVILLISKDESEQVGIYEGTLKKCYQCAEIVKKEAIRCKHCGAIFHDNDI